MRFNKTPFGNLAVRQRYELPGSSRSIPIMWFLALFDLMSSSTFTGSARMSRFCECCITSRMNSVTSVRAPLESRNHLLGIPVATPTRHQISTTRIAAARTSPWPASHTTDSDMARNTAPIFIIRKFAVGSRVPRGSKETQRHSRLPVGNRRRPLRSTAIFSPSGTGSAATAFFEQAFEAKRPLRFNGEAIPQGAATGSRFRGHANRRLADDDQLWPVHVHSVLRGHEVPVT